MYRKIIRMNNNIIRIYKNIIGMNKKLSRKNMEAIGMTEKGDRLVFGLATSTTPFQTIFPK